MRQPVGPNPSVLANVVPPKAVLGAELEEAARDGKGAEYFKAFNLATLVQLGQPLTAYNEALRILGEARSASVTSFRTIHKGGPYYWLGITAFLARDFETAVCFMDSAVAEDLRRDPTTSGTPALLFLSLDPDHPWQTAIELELVSLALAGLTNLMGTYNATPGVAGPAFSISDLRTSFLSEAVTPTRSVWRSMATAFISFVLEYELRSRQINVVISPASKEPFILHLFKGSLLFERFLKANPLKSPPGDTLGPALRFLAGELGVPSDIPTLAASLQEVIDRCTRGQPSIPQAIEATAKMRHTSGHDLGSGITLSGEQYKLLFEGIAIAIIHSIRSLYQHVK